MEIVWTSENNYYVGMVDGGLLASVHNPMQDIWCWSTMLKFKSYTSGKSLFLNPKAAMEDLERCLSEWTTKGKYGYRVGDEVRVDVRQLRFVWYNLYAGSPFSSNPGVGRVTMKYDDLFGVYFPKLDRTIWCDRGDLRKPKDRKHMQHPYFQ